MIKKSVFLTVFAFLCSCGVPERDIKPAPEAKVPSGFALSSADITDNADIPAMFTCDGDNISPALKWTGAPANAGGFILTLRDPDAPGGDFLHWAAANIPPSVTAAPRGVKFPASAAELENDFGAPGYGGPCPPAGNPHHYVFTLYAVDAGRFDGTPPALADYLAKHTIAKAALTGLYKRK